MAKVEIDGKQKELEILVTTKRTNPLLGLHWMKKLGITLETDKTVPQIQQIKEDPDITSLKTKFKKLFTENHTVNGLEVKIQLKEDAKLIQQKGRPIPIHLQQSVGKEIEKLIKQGHLKSQQYRRKLLRKSSRNHGKERQINKNRPRFAKIE